MLTICCHCPTSDIDVAILPLNPLPPGLLSSIRESLEESLVPFTVDVIDLSQAEPAFKERVEREGIEGSPALSQGKGRA